MRMFRAAKVMARTALRAAMVVAKPGCSMVAVSILIVRLMSRSRQTSDPDIEESLQWSVSRRLVLETLVAREPILPRTISKRYLDKGNPLARWKVGRMIRQWDDVSCPSRFVSLGTPD
jgi:hypothetical protein